MNYRSYAHQSMSGYRPSMADIYSIFGQHRSSLYEQKGKANQAIDDWSNDLAQQIRDHAFEQKRLVEQAFANQEKYLNEMRDQFVAISRVYDQEKSSTDEIDRLLEKCRSLVVKLAEFNFTPRDIQFINVTPIEPQSQMNLDEFHSKKAKERASENSSIKRSEPELTHGRDFDSRSQLSSSITDQTNRPSANQPTNTSNRSSIINETTSKRVNVMQNYSSNDKCPVCRMVFPPTMSTTARSLHVSEHYSND